MRKIGIAIILISALTCTGFTCKANALSPKKIIVKKESSMKIKTKPNKSCKTKPHVKSNIKGKVKPKVKSTVKPKLNPKVTPIVKSHQKYTFAPCANPNNISTKDKKLYQDILDNLGDVKKNTLDIQPLGIYFFDDEGNFNLLVFIRNGFDVEVNSIKSHICVTIDGKTIGAKNIEFDNESFGSLPGKMSRIYGIQFAPEEIQEKPDLSKSKTIEITAITEFKDQS